MPDRSVTYTFKGNFSGLTAGLATAGRNVQEFGGKLTALDRNGARMRAGLDQLGGTAGKIGLVAAAGLGAVVLKAADFDQAMSKVQAATHETAGNMDRLREAAIKAGADTVFSATESAAAIEELAKAGVSTSDVLGGGLDGSLALAAAGSLDVAEAAEIAASAMTQFKLEGSDVGHVADLLAAGAGKAQGSVQDLGMALSQGGLVAAQTGLSIEETTTALAAMASAGLVGSDAGTSLKTMLLALTPQSKKAADAMAAIGFSAYDSQGQFVGLEAVAGQLQTAMAGMSEEQRNATMKVIFGNDAIRAANVLYEQGATGIDSWAGKVDDAGYAAETAAINMDNLKGDLEQLGGALETAFIGAGEGSQGPLRKLTQGLTDAVNVFNKLPSSAQSTTTALLGITAITGGGLWFGSKVVQGVADTRQALADLGPAGTRAASGLGKVAARGPAILIAAQAMGALYNATTDFGNAINEADLSRDLDQIASGSTTDSLDKLTGALEGVNEAGAGTVNALFSLPSALTGIQTSFSANKETVEAFDQQLASLVESGNAEQAAEAFQAIRDAAASRGGVSDSDVVKSFDSYQTALDNAATSADEASAATYDFGDAQEQAAEDSAEYQKALKELRDQQTQIAKGFVGLGDSLNDSKVSLGDWIDELAENAKALEDFTANSKRAAKKGLKEGLVQELQNAGTEGALRMKQLANATDEEIDRANKAWKRGQKAVDDFVDATGRIPATKATELIVKAGAAMADVAAFRSRWESLRDKTIHLDVVRRDSSGVDFVSGGQRKASGGYISGPGTGTSDSIPAWLSNGEFVMRASAVQRYGVGFMHALNAQRFASGGSVSDRRSNLADLRSSLGDFRGVDLTSADAVAEALKDVGKALKGVGREWSAQMLHHADQLKAASADYERAAAGVEAASSALDDLMATARAFQEQAASVYSSSFAGQSLSGALKTVGSDVAHQQVKSNALSSLVASGQLDATSDLYKELATSDSWKLLSQAVASPAAFAQLQAMYEQRSSLGAAFGAEAAGAAYSKALEAQNRILDEQLRLERDARAAEAREHKELVAAVDAMAAKVGQEINASAKAGRDRGKARR